MCRSCCHLHADRAGGIEHLPQESVGQGHGTDPICHREHPEERQIHPWPRPELEELTTHVTGTECQRAEDDCAQEFKAMIVNDY